MPFKLIGKVLFPRLQAWERTRKAKQIIYVTLVALMASGIVAVLIFKQNSVHH